MNGIFQTKLQTSSLALVGNTYVSKVCFVFEQSLSVLCSGLNYHEDHLLQKKFHSNLLGDTALKRNALLRAWTI